MNDQSSRSVDKRKVFVVHGRNEAARVALFEFLRAIGLAPIEWEEAIATTAQGSPFIGNVLDGGFASAQACVVLITGDDVARVGTRYLLDHDPPEERNLTPQARPNVLFEAGMAFAIFPARTIVVRLGHTRQFSDIGGRHTINSSDSVASRQKLSDRLETAGCAVQTHGKTDWHQAGNFAAAILQPDLPDSNPTAITVRDKSDIPRIAIAVEHPKGGMTPTTAFVITNVGELELHKLRLETVTIGQHEMTFRNNISVLKRDESTNPIFPTIKSLGALFQHDVVMAMRSDVEHQGRGDFIDVATFPASATYEDWEENRFKATWNYEFSPHIHRGHELRREKRTEEVFADTLGPYLVVSSVKTERW